MIIVISYQTMSNYRFPLITLVDCTISTSITDAIYALCDPPPLCTDWPQKKIVTRASDWALHSQVELSSVTSLNEWWMNVVAPARGCITTDVQCKAARRGAACNKSIYLAATNLTSCCLYKIQVAIKTAFGGNCCSYIRNW